MRHVPVEEAYDAPFRIVHAADVPFRCSYVGSVLGSGECHRRQGAHARSEIRAAVLGLRMALQIHRATGVAFFELLTDSMFVVQSLKDDLVAGKHAGAITTLLQVWTELRCTCQVSVRWGRGHSGHVLNELADRHAKSMVSPMNTSTRVQYCYVMH